MKRVLITGASGFIGRHCLESLLKKGYEVHAVSSKIREMNDQRIRWHVADLLDTKQISLLIEHVQPSHLLHFAWNVSPSSYRTSPENLRWAISSLELLRSFESNGGKRVVIAGTCFEYDETYGYCSEQTTPLKPTTLYGTYKHSLQIMLDAYAIQTGISASWGRIFYLFGPFEHQDRLIPSVIKSLLMSKCAYCSHGEQIRDFLYVKDVADAFISLLNSQVEGAVNVASGRPVALREIIQKIADRLNRPDLIQLGAVPVSPNEPPLLIADVRRLNNEVGWKPKYSLDQGLDETISWWTKTLGVNGF